MVLTPTLFRDLDSCARQKYGCVLVVCTPEEMCGNWGSYNACGASVYIDAAAERCAEVPAIRIANAIEPNSFAAARRPEMDWAAIPLTDIFRFVVLHEAGHRLHNLPIHDFIFGPASARPDGHRLYARLRYVNEALADRFAWSELCPGRPLPKARLLAEDVRQLERDIAECTRMFPPRSIVPKPLPWAPSYVPRQHVDRGIPFADGRRPARYGARGAILARGGIRTSPRPPASFLTAV